MIRYAVRALALALILYVFSSPASAAEVVAQAPLAAVKIPFGDWVVALGELLTSVLLPALVAFIMGAISKLFPFARLFISTQLVERLVRNVADYALNAVEEAAKDKMLSVPVGSVVIAKAVQRAVDEAPAWLLNAAGGPAGIAEKVFRLLKLEPEATAANTLAPALAAVPPTAKA